MSENTQKDMEQIVQEEMTQETPVQEETVVKEKKGCTRKENKKDTTKIEELEAQVAELENKVAKDKDLTFTVLNLWTADAEHPNSKHLSVRYEAKDLK